MTSVEQVLRAAWEKLVDHGESPRSPLMLSLSELIERPDTVPTNSIELKALLAPGGKHTVTDQDGRQVLGVKSVAVFEDAQGNSVFQVNL